MFGKPNPTFRAVRTHICKSPVCKTASLGVKQVELETRPTDAMVAVQALLGKRQICDINLLVDENYL